jgi:hypothetical protein
MSNITKEQVIEWLSGQSVIDLAALVKDLEGKWGVSAATAVAAAPGCRRCRCPGRSADRIHRHPQGGRCEQDRRHQGSPCDHRPGPQGGQGSGRRRPEARQGERSQGRSRRDQEEARGGRRQGRAQVNRPRLAFYVPKRPISSGQAVPLRGLSFAFSRLVLLFACLSHGHAH